MCITLIGRLPQAAQFAHHAVLAAVQGMSDTAEHWWLRYTAHTQHIPHSAHHTAHKHTTPHIQHTTPHTQAHYTTPHTGMRLCCMGRIESDWCTEWSLTSGWTCSKELPINYSTADESSQLQQHLDKLQQLMKVRKPASRADWISSVY